MKDTTFNSPFGSSLLSSEKEIASFKKHWAWMLVAGVLYVLLGVLAFSMPVASTVGLTLFISSLLLAGGIILFVQAFRMRHEIGSATRFVQSLIAIVAGGVMLRYPNAGMMGVALMLSFYFFINAAAHWILASSLRPIKGLNWGYFSAACSFLLGVYILATFPFSALWIPGTLLGIDLIFAGCTMIVFSMSIRRGIKETPRSKTSEEDSHIVPAIHDYKILAQHAKRDRTHTSGRTTGFVFAANCF